MVVFRKLNVQKYCFLGLVAIFFCASSFFFLFIFAIFLDKGEEWSVIFLLVVILIMSLLLFFI